MATERLVYALEVRPNQWVRILVNGELDTSMVASIKAFAEFQDSLLLLTPTEPLVGLQVEKS